jgi:membrane protein
MPPAARARRAVEDPGRDTILALAVRTVRRYLSDGMTDRAPAIAYYGILSLFPSFLLAFSLVRLVGGEGAAADLSHYAQDHGASGAVADALRSAASTARKAPVPSAGAIGAVSVLTLVYGASRSFTATGRALDAIARRATAGRSLRRRAEDVAWTFVLIVMAIGVLIFLTLSGRVLDDVLDALDIDRSLSTAWLIARWPIGIVLALVTVGTVKAAAPSGPRARFRPFAAGTVVSVLVLVVATAGFDVYVSSIASYNTTYGAFAGAVILLLWIWLVSSALLFGAELDAVLGERRQPGSRASAASVTSSTS